MSLEIDENQFENEGTELPEGVAPTEEGGAAAASAPAAKDDDVRASVRELADIIKQQNTPKKVEKELTQDEIDEAWAVFNPEKKDPKFFHRYFRLPADATPEELADAKAVWLEQHQGTMKQAVVAARNFQAQAMEELRKEFAPVLQMLEQQKVEAVRNSFYGAYPELKQPKYGKLVAACSADLAGKQFDSQESYNKALAESVESAVKEYVPDFALSKQTKTAGTPPRLPRTSAGGTGGAGGARAAAGAASGNDIDSLGGE